MASFTKHDWNELVLGSVGRAGVRSQNNLRVMHRGNRVNVNVIILPAMAKRFVIQIQVGLRNLEGFGVSKWQLRTSTIPAGVRLIVDIMLDESWGKSAGSVKRADLHKVLSSIDRVFKLSSRRRHLTSAMLRSLVTALRSAESQEKDRLSRQALAELDGLRTLILELARKLEQFERGQGARPSSTWERKQVQSIYRVRNGLLRRLGSTHANLK